MNKTELKRILDTENFNPRAYSLEGGLPSERLCLSDDKYHWSVYYSEHGKRTSEKTYASESEACQDLLERLRSLPDWQSRLPSAC